MILRRNILKELLQKIGREYNIIDSKMDGMIKMRD
jgi:hypothetical protein